MIDVSTVLTVVGSGGAAVASVGVACLGVRAQIAAFRAVRAAGGSVSEGFAAGRSGQSAEQRQRLKDNASGVTASGRQMEKEYEAMWVDQAKRK